MFNFNNGDFGSHDENCICPLCRGAKNVNIDFSDTNGIFVDVNENAYIDEDIPTPEEIVDYYYDAIYDCDDPEELEEILIEFFNEVATFALQSSYMADIEAKIMLLNQLHNEQ